MLRKPILFLLSFLAVPNLFSQEIEFDFKSYNAQSVTSNLTNEVIVFTSTLVRLVNCWKTQVIVLKKQNDSWKEQKIILPNIEKEECFHVNNIFISESGQFMLASLASNKGNSDLFHISLDTTISSYALDALNSKYDDQNPILSTDENKLFYIRRNIIFELRYAIKTSDNQWQKSKPIAIPNFIRNTKFNLVFANHDQLIFYIQEFDKLKFYKGRVIRDELKNVELLTVVKGTKIEGNYVSLSHKNLLLTSSELSYHFEVNSRKGIGRTYTTQILALPKEVEIEMNKKIKLIFNIALNINFDFNSSEIQKMKDKLSLDSIANAVLKHEKGYLEISAHTDKIGSDSTNIVLSQARAEMVALYLEKKGINKDRLRTFGYGASKPISPNNTPQNRAKNRRVEIAFFEEE